MNDWRGHKLRRVKVNHSFKYGVWLGGYLVVPSEEASYDKSTVGEWRRREWESMEWDVL